MKSLNKNKKVFGVDWEPKIPFGIVELPEEIRRITGGRMSLSGVQKKASVKLDLPSHELRITQFGGTHILKPDPEEYPELSLVEDLCMDMAQVWGMDVPPHTVLPMRDGTPAYLIKRFDRLKKGEKIHKEDMAQLLQLPTDSKYEGTLEKIGKIILKHATNTYLDLVNFYERTLFSFVIGNGDMHLKNWALIERPGHQPGMPFVQLAPCYDFVSSSLFIRNEEDSALALNGKRNKLSRKDFEIFGQHLNLDELTVKKIFKKWAEKKSPLISMVQLSDLSRTKKESFVKLMNSRLERLLKVF